MNLAHITLNTGHIASLPRVEREVTRKMSDIARHGGDLGPLLPPMAGWRVDVELRDGYALFSLNLGPAPITDSMVCWHDDIAAQAWDYHERFYLKLSDTHAVEMSAKAVPARPAATPWCATILLHSVSALPVSPEMALAVKGLGELERIISWAIIDNAEARP